MNCFVCGKPDCNTYKLLVVRDPSSGDEPIFETSIRVGICDDHLTVMQNMPAHELTARLRRMKPGGQ
jgi:hypothetical protein